MLETIAIHNSNSSNSSPCQGAGRFVSPTNIPSETHPCRSGINWPATLCGMMKFSENPPVTKFYLNDFTKKKCPAGWWFFASHPSEKWWSESQLGWWHSIPNCFWKVIRAMFQSPPTSQISLGFSIAIFDCQSLQVCAGVDLVGALNWSTNPWSKGLNFAEKTWHIYDINVNVHPKHHHQTNYV